MGDERAPPEWFWAILEAANRQLAKLAQALHGLDRVRLEDFWGYHRLASNMLCDPWDGPFIPEVGGHLSEDGTEDLTDWVVSMGRDFWSEVSTRKRPLDVAFAMMSAAAAGGEQTMRVWDVETDCAAYQGYQSTALLPMRVYELRFGGSLLDIEDEVLERVGY